MNLSIQHSSTWNQSARVKQILIELLALWPVIQDFLLPAYQSRWAVLAIVTPERKGAKTYPDRSVMQIPCQTGFGELLRFLDESVGWRPVKDLSSCRLSVFHLMQACITCCLFLWLYYLRQYWSLWPMWGCWLWLIAPWCGLYFRHLISCCSDLPMDRLLSHLSHCLYEGIFFYSSTTEWLFLVE